MTETSDIRLELARGHWALGEYEEALCCLERRAREGGGGLRLRTLAESLVQEAETLPGSGPSAWSERLRDLARPARAGRMERGFDALEATSPSLTTSTLAELLARQGHEDRALLVAEDVLRRNPRDARALALKRRIVEGAPAKREARVIEELERWLVSARRRSRPELAE